VEVPGTPLDRPWHVVTSPSPTATARLFCEFLVAPGGDATLSFDRRPRRARQGA
jgi:hypothetical protein